MNYLASILVILASSFAWGGGEVVATASDLFLPIDHYSGPVANYHLQRLQEVFPPGEYSQVTDKGICTIHVRRSASEYDQRGYRVVLIFQTVANDLQQSTLNVADFFIAQGMDARINLELYLGKIPNVLVGISWMSTFQVYSYGDGTFRVQIRSSDTSESNVCVVKRTK